MRRDDLGALVSEHATALGQAVVRPAGGSLEVVVAGTVVALVGAGGLEVRLRPAVAAAALRTPDVEASPRGPGWVRFSPPEMDDSARDRALAWLASAVRLVGEGGRPS